MYKKSLKRILDLGCALLLVILLFPILLIIIILVGVFMGSPILYKQIRTGYHGKPFQIYKFRTMTNNTDQNGTLLPNEQRLTNFGQFLRKTSLDELPELFNVIEGKMSIVGPRPLLHDYLPYYKKDELARHEVRPGITGWAQINGRNTLTWDKKLALDVWYIENISFSLDIKILFKTVIHLLSSDETEPVDTSFTISLIEERSSMRQNQ